MYIKKFLTCLLSSCILLNMAGTNIFAAQYSDTGGHWAKNSINRWSGAGIVSGKEDGDFHPTDLLTRAEAAKVFSRLLKLETKKDLGSFKDVQPSDWHYEDLSKAYAAGIFTGKQTGLVMDPGSPLTRQELFAVLGRSLSLNESPASNRVFSDSPDLAGYAAGYANTLINMGVIQGVNNAYLAPSQGISRAQTMTILDRTIGTYADKSGTYEIKPNGITLVVASGVKLSGPVNEYPILITKNNSTVDLSEVQGIPSIIINAKNTVIENAPENSRIQTGKDASGTVVNDTIISEGSSQKAPAPKEEKPEENDPASEENKDSSSKPDAENQNQGTTTQNPGTSPRPNPSPAYPQTKPDDNPDPQEPEEEPEEADAFDLAWKDFEKGLPEASNGLLKASAKDSDYFLDLNINAIKKDASLKQGLISSGLACFKESFEEILQIASIECTDNGKTYRIWKNGKPDPTDIKSLGLAMSTGFFDRLSESSGNPVIIRSLPVTISYSDTKEDKTITLRLSDDNSSDLSKIKKIAGLASGLLQAKTMSATQVYANYGIQIPDEKKALVVTMDLNENGFLKKLIEKLKGVPCIYNSLPMIFEQAATVEKLLNALGKYEVTNPDYLAAIDTVLSNPEIINYILDRVFIEYGQKTTEESLSGSYAPRSLLKSDAIWTSSSYNQENSLKRLIDSVKDVLSEDTLKLSPSDFKAKKDGEYAVPFKVTVKSKDKFSIDKNIEETVVLVLKANLQSN